MIGVRSGEAAALYYEVAGMAASAYRQRQDNAQEGRIRRAERREYWQQHQRHPLPRFLEQTLAAAREIQAWQEQSLRDLRAQGYEVTEVQDSLVIRSRNVHPGPLTATEYRTAITELQHRLNNPEATRQGALREIEQDIPDTNPQGEVDPR